MEKGLIAQKGKEADFKKTPKLFLGSHFDDEIQKVEEKVKEVFILHPLAGQFIDEFEEIACPGQTEDILP